MKTLFVRLYQENEGQAVVEYVLMLVLVLTIITTLTVAFRRFIFSLWQTFSCEISAACPSCDPPPEIRNQIFHSCR